ncbi:Leucine Rich Repeat [Seminavis robusta]|uniref:Leucine Rich Repeat n=1 Tax=Seminavis robusta TaxID=568900 RepID=A0A9N8HRM1_9STRA|nr:Leucine Rich Repeat [Seminavis robusta]|eukprot:Sro1336_g264030.1 Leucine Rich Repeat (404) ;mRNA; f:15636-16999
MAADPVLQMKQQQNATSEQTMVTSQEAEIEGMITDNQHPILCGLTDAVNTTRDGISHEPKAQPGSDNHIYFSPMPQPLPSEPDRFLRPDLLVNPVGAIAVDGPFGASIDTGHRHEQQRDEEDPAETEELAVANLVAEDNGLLPTAMPQNTEATRKRQQKTKQIKTNILLVVIALLALTIVLLAILIPEKESSKLTDDTVPTTPTDLPSSNPTQAPTLVSDYFISLLGEATSELIMATPGSAQSKAWQWLLEDAQQQQPSLPIERLVQRFALAALFYATAGDNWYNNTNWLNHNISECDWFNQPEFGRVTIMRQFFGNGYLQGFFPADAQPSICGNDGLYQHLWLDRNNLAGSLPDEFYLLTTLKTVSLANNRIQGFISSHAGKLDRMEGLSEPVLARLYSNGD